MLHVWNIYLHVPYTFELFVGSVNIPKYIRRIPFHLLFLMVMAEPALQTGIRIKLDQTQQLVNPRLVKV